MLKKKCIVLSLVVLFIGVIHTHSFASVQGVITGETVKLRDGASLEAGLVMLLSVDDKVEVLGKEGEWYQITFEGKTGYVYQDYIEVKGLLEEDQEEPIQEPVAPQTSENLENASVNLVVSQEEKIRLLPVIYLEGIETIPANTPVEILEERNGWAYIQSDKIAGWIRRDKIIEKAIEPKVEEPKKPEEKPIEEPKEKVSYINVETVNVRKAPDIASEVIENAYKNEKVVIVGEENNWAKVTIKGKTGYIASKYLSEKPVEVTNRSASTSRLELKNETAREEEKKNQALGKDIVTYAKSFLGYPYITGGTTPKGFDCSGFTKYVYSHFGYSLNRTSSAQAQNGISVSKDNLQLGDLVFFSQGSKAIGHVGIYIGGNQFIHASNPSDGVKITSLSNSYYAARYVTARRII